MSRTRVGINGLGRMGRLALRAGWDRDDLEFVHVNELQGGAHAAAHLLTFDSVHVGIAAPKVRAAPWPSTAGTAPRSRCWPGDARGKRVDDPRAVGDRRRT